MRTTGPAAPRRRGTVAYCNCFRAGAQAGKAAAIAVVALVDSGTVGSATLPVTFGSAAYGLLVLGAGLDHRRQLDRTSATLEPDVLALGRVQELLPQASGRRVRRVLADRLVVVPGERCPARVDDLPVRRDVGGQAPGLGAVQVVPVDQDRALCASITAGGVAVGRVEVAVGLQRLEEGDARLMLVSEPPLLSAAA